jgi:FixJ family two-component response regulator
VRSNGLSIPVVVVATADDDVYSAVKAMQAGAADFIQRPIMERDFIERIDKIVNKPD